MTEPTAIDILAEHMTPEEFAELTLKVNRRAKVANALLEWAETTHGNEFGHDHHCKISRFSSKGPWADEAGDPKVCTCGWSKFRVLYDAGSGS